MGELCGLAVSGQKARLSKWGKTVLGSKLAAWATEQDDCSKEPNGATSLMVEGLQGCMGTMSVFPWCDGARRWMESWESEFPQTGKNMETGSLTQTWVGLESMRNGFNIPSELWFQLCLLTGIAWAALKILVVGSYPHRNSDAIGLGLKALVVVLMYSCG